MGFLGLFRGAGGGFLSLFRGAGGGFLSLFRGAGGFLGFFRSRFFD